MSRFVVPDQIADRMVELLFDETTSTFGKRILYPGCGEGELIAAVERYFESSVHDPPDGVAIDTDEDCLERVEEAYGDRVDVRQADYLSADDRVDEFDFVVSFPPEVEWATLSEEKRAEYATSFAQILPEASSVHTGLLFVERSLHVLKEDGRGVFLMPRAFKTDPETEPFRSYLTPKVADIEQIDNDRFEPIEPHLILEVTSPESEEFEPATSSFRPDPSVVESQLMASALPSTDAYDAGRLATTHPELDTYAASDDAAYVYLDLYYEDYDAALVYGDPEARTDLRGYVSRATMDTRHEETVIDHTIPLSEEDCLAPDASIGTVVDELGVDGNRFRFVGSPEEPKGIVTRFDLNKMPVYQYLYVLLARFEIRCREVVREHAPDWEEEVEVHISATNAGELSPDKLSGATMRDLLNILDETGSTDRIHPNLAEHTAGVEDLRELRNAIAHYNPLVYYMSNDVESEWTANDLRMKHRLLQNIFEF